MENRLAVLLGLALVAGPPAAHATTFFTGLGILPGATSSEAAAVSADGSTVVGTSGDDGFRWTSGEGLVALERPPGRSFTTAADVSGDGSVIVGSGLRWTAGGVQDIGVSTAVSQDGMAVVGSGAEGVYRWTEAEGAVRIPALDHFDLGPDIHFSSYPTDISGDGSVIVGYWFDGDETWNGFRWSDAGGLTGAGGDVAYAVSSGGSTVVGQRNNFDNDFFGWWPREAYLWTMGQGDAVGLGFLQPVPDPLEGDDRRWSAALGISGDDIVVGLSCTGGSFFTPHTGHAGCAAFLWDSLNGMRALQDVLEDEHGLDLTGWTLRSAADISSDGRTIVGTGTNPDGATEAWIAHLPEPGPFGLIAMGLAGLAARNRRRERKSRRAGGRPSRRQAGRRRRTLPAARSQHQPSRRLLSRTRRRCHAAAAPVTQFAEGHREGIALIALGIALVAGAPAAHATAFFTGLGILPGATRSEAAAVSADGSTVVGTSGDDGFRWTSGEGLVALERPPGRSFTTAADVSGDGSVIVGSGLRWTAGGVQDIGVSTAVSQDGTVAVGKGADGIYRWTEAEGAVRIPALDDVTTPWDVRFSRYPTDISGDGSVIVAYSYDGDESWNAFRWSAARGLTGAAGDIANAISSDGSIVVGRAMNWEDFYGWWPREAYLYEEGQRAVRLGFVQPFDRDDPNSSLDDWRWSSAFGVSDEGLVVGQSCESGRGSYFSPDPGSCSAFLWDPTDGMRALQDVLEEEYGLDLTGWTLGSGADITPDGRTIVGTGINPSGATEAWIAFLPEPGTAGLLALGLAGLAARERRQGRKVVASWRSSQ